MRLLALLSAAFPLLLPLATSQRCTAVESAALHDTLSTDGAWACAMDALVALSEPLTPTDVAAVCASPACVAYLRETRPLLSTCSSWPRDDDAALATNLAALVNACADTACSSEQDALVQSLIAEVRNPHCDAAMEALGPHMTSESFCTLRPCTQALRAILPRLPPCALPPTVAAFVSLLHSCDAAPPNL
ncbi:hypothetical protein SDRG_05481 [Saprolegnia diclina VS20]|uniref:Saposin B-type domain-containing protein n=1 Tax=Saprolegnia diclina (strain VS20) TaxID=1156394 RepID=T0S3D6_SAPDV|nr:hypothetical protein SDRG_05481 [Saprolegnia diclina VS20]EQC37257.1 hypothetical protein SDRG_05481 [Saprolegnia diclina VS20]|eukprot:XP_008609419.1 hypothetical protein SDRG_05481 [Saprolegnia diclina VS20]